MQALDRQNVHLVFERCTYTVRTKLDGKPKGMMTRKANTIPRELITGLTAEVHSGHVLSILGPSGAGKTTLLNMLS